MFSRFLLILLLFTGVAQLRAQDCTVLGQTPATAFPVCGTNTFAQQSVPICATRNIPVPCTDNAAYQNKNPFWYKFTCFAPGTLAFSITPSNLNDDYDWQIFDVTNRNPDDIFTDPSLFVCCNWSARPGATGTNLTNTNISACAGMNTPNYSAAPTLVLGHNYLLLVSHFTNSQEGYSLRFSGGTASITDTTPPRLKSIIPACDGRQLTILLNKKMKCSTIAANASDFTFSPAITNNPATVAGGNCSTGFDTDSITLTFQNALAAGNYQLIAQNGTDGNTILDNCNNGIATGSALPFTIAYGKPTPFDSLAPVGCAPQTLKVIFRKPIRCSTIASDGSDFVLSGSPLANVIGVAGICNSSGETSIVEVKLSQPLQTAGNFQLRLKRGNDGNTVIDICGQETVADAFIPFTTKDTVSARFTYDVFLDCKKDSIAYHHDGRNGVVSWNWLMDNTRTIREQNPVISYTIFGQKTARLIVSNGVCTDTATATINLDNYLKAAFISPDVLCPRDTAIFGDSSIGKITVWSWNFGNGITSNQQVPPIQIYPPTMLQTTYPVRLTVQDRYGCRDSVTKQVIVVSNCLIDVPTAFTPNGDGLNDYLYPLNAYKAERLLFEVYNRYGQRVWQTTDWIRKWDGRINGQLLQTGAYVWFLTYTHKETKRQVRQQGTTVLIR